MTFDEFVKKYNFNSHAHVERDDALSGVSSQSSISTHTLTWSVTYKTATLNNIPAISTHTLTWSVTPSGNYRVRIYDISTHTLTWSVT